MGLISLVYMSMSHHPMNDEELMQILEVARSHNQAHDITGMLLYRDDLFIQVMEGEESIVLPLYEKIKADPRHHHVLEVYQGAIENRVFGQWAMGFNRVNDIDLHDIPGFTEYLENNSEQDFFTDHPHRVIQLLEAFKHHAYF